MFSNISYLSGLDGKLTQADGKFPRPMVIFPTPRSLPQASQTDWIRITSWSYLELQISIWNADYCVVQHLSKLVVLTHSRCIISSKIHPSTKTLNLAIKKIRFSKRTKSSSDALDGPPGADWGRVVEAKLNNSSQKHRLSPNIVFDTLKPNRPQTIFWIALYISFQL